MYSSDKECKKFPELTLMVSNYPVKASSRFRSYKLSFTNRCFAPTSKEKWKDMCNIRI